jgi:hypothetical protein
MFICDGKYLKNVETRKVMSETKGDVNSKIMTHIRA